jgi:hypothetical protein
MRWRDLPLFVMGVAYDVFVTVVTVVTVAAKEVRKHEH